MNADSDNRLSIALACGGTGGHIFPGLAVAEVLRSRGHDVALWMTGRDIEQKALEGWDGRVINISSQGLQGGVSLRFFSSIKRLASARRKSIRQMKKQRPDAVVAMGSYASAGPAAAALHLNIPLILHEANVIPGRAIALFARRATSVAAHFEETRYYLKRKNIVVTGMPLRTALETAALEPVPEREGGGPMTILVMGGSHGAHALNAAVPAGLARLAEQGLSFRVIHLTGRQDEEAVKEAYKSAGIVHEVFPFVHDMLPLYRRADLAICRSGASTCAELAAFRLPSLMVPYPHAARDHQTANARAFEKSGAADMVAEPDLSADWLAEFLAQRLMKPEKIQEMARAAHSRYPGSASERLADVIEKAAIDGRT